jgi:hypothetical protein
LNVVVDDPDSEAGDANQRIVMLDVVCAGACLLKSLGCGHNPDENPTSCLGCILPSRSRGKKSATGENAADRAVMLRAIDTASFIFSDSPLSTESMRRAVFSLY